MSNMGPYPNGQYDSSPGATALVATEAASVLAPMRRTLWEAGLSAWGSLVWSAAAFSLVSLR